jgi:hypothetical protein
MIKKFFALAMMLGTLTAMGQVSNKSPYSFYGIGDSNQQTSVAASGMGGLNIALRGEYELNFTNPAQLSSLKLTSFDIGGTTKFLTIQDSSQKQESANTTLGYLALGFPITSKMGFVAGLQPNTNVGYNIADEIRNDEDELTEVSIFEGNGGTNRFFMGTGYEVYKGLSLGAEVEFLFGTINNSLIYQNAEIIDYTRYKVTSKINGTGIKLGANYKTKLKENIQLNVEGSMKLASKLKQENDQYLYSFFYNSYGVEIPQDTLIADTEVDAKISRPAGYQFGLGIGNPNQWYAGVSYAMQDAWKFDSTLIDNSKVNYTSSNSFSLGGYFIPKKNSITSYWNRVVYRAGVRFENAGLSVQNVDNPSEYTPLKDFGISFGLGLPIGNQMSKLNMSVEMGKRGNTSGGLIQENYVNLRLGLNFAEKWFQKSKIN